MSNETNPTPITENVTLDLLRDLLQQAGYRVEIVRNQAGEQSYLRSATSRFGFDVRPGNRLPEKADCYADFVLVGAFRVEGELPLEVVNRWNNLRRFARLHLDGSMLVVSMDVPVIGGVARAHLLSCFTIWDQLVQDLMAWLRDELPKLAPANGAQGGHVLEKGSPQPPVSKPSPASISGRSEAAPGQNGLEPRAASHTPNR